MPSTRVANFEPVYVEAELMPEGTQRALPPASLGLRAPADVADRADMRWRREHPAKRGRPREDEETEDVSALTVYEAMRTEALPRELAEELECSERRAKDLLKSARTRLASRIDEYLDAHLVATKVAAMRGDAKPSQWALENASIEGERVVTPPAKESTSLTPTFNVGFVLGGMPQQAKLLPPGKS